MSEPSLVKAAAPRITVAFVIAAAVALAASAGTALAAGAGAAMAPSAMAPSGDFEALREAAIRPGGEIPDPVATPAPAPDLPPIDVRSRAAGSFAPLAAASHRVASARRGLLARLGPSGIVEMDAVTGRPRYVARLGGVLTGPSDASAERVVTDWLLDNRGLYGLDRDDLRGLVGTDSYPAPGGLTTIHWHQSIDGLEVVNEELAAALDADGRLIQVIGPARPDLDGASTDHSLGAGDAIAVATTDAGAAPDSAQSADLVLYGTGGGVRPAWQVEVEADSRHYWQYEVDARDGRILSRGNLVAFESAKTFDLWPRASTFGSFGGGAATVRPLKRLGSGQDDPWRYNTMAPPYNLPFQTLGGNQALLLLDFNDDDGATATADFFVHPSDGANNWIFDQQYVNNAAPLKCPPGGRCTWSPVGFFQNWYLNAFQNGTQVYWFVNQFHDHLEAAPIGFTERSGNFELVNQDGNGGLANDDVFLQALDGANTGVGYPDGKHVNNANMLTLRDGVHPRMQMYLFTQFPAGGLPAPGTFEVDGGDDATVVYHEYTHGLSNRLVGGPSTQGTLQAPQSGAMGEGWSDFYAQDYLVGGGLIPDNPGRSGDLKAGRYENFDKVRTQPLDCAVGAPKRACPAKQGGKAGSGGYTFGDYGRILGQPEVHADGEIWAQTLWDLRAAMIKKFGKGRGIGFTELLVTNGLRLAPIQPSFLDARDAILQADAANKGFNAKKTIWRVFAHRGMGSNARTSGPNDKHPRQGFNNPTAR